MADDPELVDQLEAFADQRVQIVEFSEVLEPRGFDVIRSGAEPRRRGLPFVCS